jgi:molybdopterin biosynthesis enzyme
MRGYPSLQAAAECVASLTHAGGAAVTRTALPARDADTIARAFAESLGDVIVMIGGTGFGRHDHAAEALAAAGSLIAHGIALRPGDTSGCGLVERTPIILVPGSLDAALAVTLMLVLPSIDLLAGAAARQPSVSGRLTRKISSSVGVTELTLLRGDGPSLEQLGTGDLTLEAVGRATAWLTIPAESEGIAAGETVTAFLL